jgi:hypothetical protein
VDPHPPSTTPPPARPAAAPRQLVELLDRSARWSEKLDAVTTEARRSGRIPADAVARLAAGPQPLATLLATVLTRLQPAQVESVCRHAEPAQRAEFLHALVHAAHKAPALGSIAARLLPEAVLRDGRVELLEAAWLPADMKSRLLAATGRGAPAPAVAAAAAPQPRRPVPIAPVPSPDASGPPPTAAAAPVPDNAAAVLPAVRRRPRLAVAGPQRWILAACAGTIALAGALGIGLILGRGLGDSPVATGETSADDDSTASGTAADADSEDVGSETGPPNVAAGASTDEGGNDAGTPADDPPAEDTSNGSTDNEAATPADPPAAESTDPSGCGEPPSEDPASTETPPDDSPPQPATEDVVYVSHWAPLGGRSLQGDYNEPVTFQSRVLSRNRLPAGVRLRLHGLRAANENLILTVPRRLEVVREPDGALGKLTIKAVNERSLDAWPLAEFWISGGDSLSFKWLKTTVGDERFARNWLGACTVEASNDAGERVCVALCERSVLPAMAMNANGVGEIDANRRGIRDAWTFDVPLTLTHGVLTLDDGSAFGFHRPAGSGDCRADALADRWGGDPVTVAFVDARPEDSHAKLRVSVDSAASPDVADLQAQSDSLRERISELNRLIDLLTDAEVSPDRKVATVAELAAAIGLAKPPELDLPDDREARLESLQAYSNAVRDRVLEPAKQIVNAMRQEIARSAAAVKDETAMARKATADRLATVRGASAVLARVIDDDPDDGIVIYSEDIVIGDPGPRPEEPAGLATAPSAGNP